MNASKRVAREARVASSVERAAAVADSVGALLLLTAVMAAVVSGVAVLNNTW